MTHSKPSGAKNINIAAVTRELISLMLRLSEGSKQQTLQAITGQMGNGPEDNAKTAGNIGAQLVRGVMNMTPEKRYRLLGELKAERRGTSKRIYPRQEYITPVHCSVKQTLIKGFITDISKGGAFIDTSRIRDLGFSSGDPIIMNFIHPNCKSHLRARGRIARITKKGLGVRFDILL